MNGEFDLEKFKKFVNFLSTKNILSIEVADVKINFDRTSATNAYTTEKNKDRDLYDEMEELV